MEEKILKAIKKANKLRGLSLQELSELTGLCRNTISKHVGILEAKNKVILDMVGNVKLVFLNESELEKK